MNNPIDQKEQGLPVPHSNEAEQAVLGGLMLANDVWDSVSEIISESDFFLSVHRIIFSEMRTLVKQHSPIDLLTLSEVLKGNAEGLGIWLNFRKIRRVPLTSMPMLILSERMPSSARFWPLQMKLPCKRFNQEA